MKMVKRKWKYKATVKIDRTQTGDNALLGIPRRLANAHHSFIVNAYEMLINPKNRNKLYIKPNRLIISEKFYSPRRGSFERSIAEPTTAVEAMINRFERLKELTPSK